MFGNDKGNKAPEPNEMLLKAFENTYQLVGEEKEADEVFDYAKLRQFFGAMQIPKMPDPLPPYIEELEDRGYQFKMSWSGDPAIFVQRRNKPSTVHFCPSLEDMTENNATCRIEQEGEGRGNAVYCIEQGGEVRGHLEDCSAWEDLMKIEEEEKDGEDTLS